MSSSLLLQKINYLISGSHQILFFKLKGKMNGSGTSFSNIAYNKTIFYSEAIVFLIPYYCICIVLFVTKYQVLRQIIAYTIILTHELALSFEYQ